MFEYKVEDVMSDFDKLYVFIQNVSNKYNCDIKVNCERNTFINSKTNVDVSILKNIEITVCDSDGACYKHIPKEKRREKKDE